MRIRRNQWLTYMLAASITVCATANARAQGTTATISTADSATTSSAAAPVFNKLEAGDQLIYKTKGTVAMEGLGQGKDQKEDLDLTTSLTVLQKSGDKLTLYAVLTAAEETTAGKTSVPGPRFTFELPVSGAAPNEEFEKAGLSGASFPTFSVETLFATPAPEGKSSSSISLPVTNAMLEGEAVTTREGANLKTVTSASQETTPVLTRTTMFSSEKNLTESIETSVSMSLAARNMPITINISDKTNLVSVQRCRQIS